MTRWADAQGLELYPHQEEAILSLLAGDNVVLATPTGSGKSLVAVAGAFAMLAEGRRAVYTAPIKALVSEKFFELVAQLGADNVGMVTGDASRQPASSRDRVHRRDPRQPSLAGGDRHRCRPRDHGRVPLLRRP